MIRRHKDFTWAWLCAVGLQFAMETVAQTAGVPNTPAKNTSGIPWDQIGVKAGVDYHGEGLSVAATEAGARLHCIFQRLDGEATTEGLWLVSSVTNHPAERFRVMATQVGRVPPCAPALPSEPTGGQGTARPTVTLPLSGKIDVTGHTVRFTRAGLVEEYSVSLDGVRQDFEVPEKPPGEGQLQVGLEVAGARVEAMPGGARLVLEASGRKLAYSRLHATDAKGKELPARLEAEPPSASRIPHSALEPLRTPHSVLRIWVDDADAVYPVRIDPTFSDANWISMGGIPGTDGEVYATVGDAAGSLYIGGIFTVVGNVLANNIAQWNGSRWSPLGSGVGGDEPYVYALAVSGTNLYASGKFTTAGGNAANLIAQWNGSTWSPLGSGIGPTNFYVSALAVSGGTLYAGGSFSTAGGKVSPYAAEAVLVWPEFQGTALLNP